MIINVFCPAKDKYFSLNVGLDLTLDAFKALCSNECGVAPQSMKVFLNNQPLTENAKTLASYNVAENDMFVLQTAMIPTNPRPPPALPKIDFSNIRVSRSVLHVVLLFEVYLSKAFYNFTFK